MEKGYKCSLSRMQGQPLHEIEGLAVCSGALIAFLDSDDLWLSNKVESASGVVTEITPLGSVLLNQYPDALGRSRSKLILFILANSTHK